MHGKMFRCGLFVYGSGFFAIMQLRFSGVIRILGRSFRFVGNSWQVSSRGFSYS